MIPDDVLPAAFAVISSPKRYALLLGSGISRDAGISTGWEITKDRIQKIACGLEETIPADPVAWYQKKYGTEPTFSSLFGDLKASREDQEAALREYFTVNGTAPEPTEAHRTIATMVKEGLIGLIITTNFDDLLERALRNVGVRPVVITEGSDPKKMSVIPDECRIVKVNGDYPNTTLKMTPADLSSYSPDIESYLDRIFSEYGLIICGWSAGDDKRLVEILAQERVRRYSVFWCHLEERAALPEKIVERLEPSTIRITSADELFGELYSRIEVLHRYEHTEKMSVSTAMKRVKDALREEKPELFLPDLINEETDRVLAFLADRSRYQADTIDSKEFYTAIFREHEDVTAPLAMMVATVVQYDDDNFTDLIKDTIERLINILPVAVDLSKIQNLERKTNPSYTEGLLLLRYSPALIVIYASGVTAVRAGHFNMLEAIVRKPMIRRYNAILRKKVPYFDLVNIWNVTKFGSAWISRLAQERFRSETQYKGCPYLYLSLYEIMQRLIPNRYAFFEYLDIFEYIFGLAYLANIKEEEIKENEFRSHFPGPLRSRHLCTCDLPLDHTQSFPPLPLHIITYLADLKQETAGSAFFGGNFSIFEEANREYAKGFGIEPPQTSKSSLAFF